MAGPGFPRDDDRSLMQTADGSVNLDPSYTLAPPPPPGADPYRRPAWTPPGTPAPPADTPSDVPIFSTP